jgi:amino-acid N-acetyltransferase
MDYEIITADNVNREVIIDLLKQEKLPFGDIPAELSDFIVIKANDTIVGSIGLEKYGEYGLLRSMVVVPPFRNKGLASMLVKQLEKLASESGIRVLYLLTETAAGYFSTRGFEQISREEVPEEIRRSSEFSMVCPQSATVMKKSI